MLLFLCKKLPFQEAFLPVFEAEILYKSVHTLRLVFVEFVTDVFVVIFYGVKIFCEFLFIRLDNVAYMFDTVFQRLVQGGFELRFYGFYGEPDGKHKRTAGKFYPLFRQIVFIFKIVVLKTSVAYDNACGSAFYFFS